MKVRFNRGLLLALGLVIVAVSVAALVGELGGEAGSYAISVTELYETSPSSTQRVKVHGRITDEGVSLERYGFIEFAITDADGKGRELLVSIDRSVFSAPDELAAGVEVIATGHLRGKVLEVSSIISSHSGGYSTGAPETLITAMPLAEQAAAISGKDDLTLDLVPDKAWLDGSELAVWRDQYGTEYVWDYAYRVVRDAREVDVDAVPTRVYPGETSFEDCMERAEDLAREYYTGRADFETLRRTTSRRISGSVTNGPINSYDVTYQRYMSGMPVRDLIAVTVYALSGGSDFVGIRADGSSVPETGSFNPAVSLERAISLAETTLREYAAEATMGPDPEEWMLGHPMLEVSHGDDPRLIWRSTSTWEDPDPGPDRVTFGGLRFDVVIDAITGEVLSSGQWF